MELYSARAPHWWDASVRKEMAPAGGGAGAMRSF